VHLLARMLNKLHMLQWSVITLTRTLDSAIRIRILYTVALVSLPPQNFEYPLGCCYTVLHIKGRGGVASDIIKPI
jgi:hypothetical protein